MTEPKQLPLSEVGEKGLLCSMMQSTAIYLENEQAVTPLLFQVPANQTIFDAVRKLAPDLSTIDWQALSAAFNKKELESIGGVTYLNEVFGFTPTSAGWKYYYGLTFDAYRLREAHLCAFKILEIDDPRNAGQAAEAAEAALRAIAAPAIKEPVPFKERIFQTFEWIETLAATPPQSVIKFGIEALDAALQPIERGDQLVISAETSRGKSTLASQAVLSSTDKRFAIFSVEMPWRSLVVRMFASEGRIAFSNLRQGRLTKAETLRLQDAMKRLSNRQIWIEDGQPVDVRTISAKCRALKRKGLDAVVVDYLQLVAPSTTGKRDTSREREVAEISRSLKSLALELDLAVIALSQLNEAGQLRESRAIGQDADIVLQIHHGEGGASIQIRKHRNGPRCSVPVSFDGATMRFSGPNSTTTDPKPVRWPYPEDGAK
jgi:replicative DNA helicase